MKFKREITPEVKKILKESIIMLKWTDLVIENIITNKICPDCGVKILYSDRFYDEKKIIILKRLCPSCGKIYILSGYFKDYVKAKNLLFESFKDFVMKKQMLESYYKQKDNQEKSFDDLNIEEYNKKFKY